ncbi:MAG: BON domain-containing protein [Planctomycetota bacterium]
MFISSHNQLAENVYQAVVLNPHLRQDRFEIETVGNKVTLRGTVGTYYQKQVAQEAVREIEGVELIDNDLTVEWN